MEWSATVAETVKTAAAAPSAAPAPAPAPAAAPVEEAGKAAPRKATTRSRALNPARVRYELRPHRYDHSPQVCHGEC